MFPRCYVINVATTVINYFNIHLNVILHDTTLVLYILNGVYGCRQNKFSLRDICFELITQNSPKRY